MLQEKDKQIEQLTRMLRQKQQLVETLRSQLEQGKRGSTVEVMDITVKNEGVALANREGVKVKEEAKEDMETSAEQPQPQRKMQTQCSQQTLFKLQQIHRLQVQQQQMQPEQSKQQQPQALQQQKLQQLIIQQSQQKQLQANQKKQQRPQKQQQQQKQQPLQTQQVSQVIMSNEQLKQNVFNNNLQGWFAKSLFSKWLLTDLLN